MRGEEQERSQPLKVTALNGVLHITEATQTLIIMCKVAMHEDFFLLYALDGGAGRGGADLGQSLVRSVYQIQVDINI